MALKGSPAPHWTNKPGAAASASRLVPVLDPLTGVWGYATAGEAAVNGWATGAVVDDPAGTGVTGIDETATSGLNLALLPNGFVAIY